MAISTYTELQSAIADWLNRDDLAAVIPTFISLAEVGMERVLRTRNMLVRANAPIDTQYSAVPANFLEVRSIKITSVAPIQPMEFQTMDAMDVLDSKDQAAGKPKYYTIVGPSCGYTQYRRASTQQSLRTTQGWISCRTR